MKQKILRRGLMNISQGDEKACVEFGEIAFTGNFSKCVVLGCNNPNLLDYARSTVALVNNTKVDWF